MKWLKLRAGVTKTLRPLLQALHIDTADCGIPVNALLSSASMHDSLAAIPLSLITAQRVTNCYDLMGEA